MWREVGLRGPKLLRGGAWARVAAPWQAYLLLCGGVLVVRVGLQVWRASRPAPAACVAVTCECRDIAREMGRKPAGAAPAGWVARLPGNELFLLERQQLELACPRCPPAWEGLRILHLTDLHLNGTPARDYFAAALAAAMQPPPDLIALTGDILDHQRVAGWIAPLLAGLSAPLGRYFVLGNHDLEAEPERIRAAMTSAGWTDLGGRCQELTVRGHRLLLAGSERPWLARRPVVGAQRDDEFRLLLSHAPQELAWARRQDFDLVFAGHLHGGQIRLPLLGPLSGGRYACGLFSAGPTLMHVSRGLGVMTPLRWRCPPEVTQVVLRAGGQDPPALQCDRA